jgi:hypothetical protein
MLQKKKDASYSITLPSASNLTPPPRESYEIMYQELMQKKKFSRIAVQRGLEEEI